jgi:hypothetical protein
MNNEIKNLMNKLLEKFGGLFKRENQRTYWETPTGEKHHVNTVFLRRMAFKPALVKEEVQNVEQPKQEESLVNGNGELQQSRGSEEVAETIEKVEEKGTPSETPKKKKKSRKKETKPQVENEEKQGQEEPLKEQE